MQTKFFFLTILFLLVDTTTISIGSSIVNNVGGAEKTQQVAVELSNQTFSNAAIDFPIQYSGQIKEYVSSGHAEEDGKPHFFHFNRFQKRRNRKLLCMASKLLLLLPHVGILILNVFHLLH
jgi:hypothetical protein